MAQGTKARSWRLKNMNSLLDCELWQDWQRSANAER
jgi:hypothetical protein